MKTLFLVFGVIAASVSLAASVASAAKTSSSAAAKISTGNTSLGRVLVDGRGHTLYLFSKDRHGNSTCTGACAGFWLPLIAAGKPLAGPGVKATLLGSTRRRDGRLQLTYNRHPLYTFVKDTQKGQTKGEGLSAFGGQWNAISQAGAKVARPPKPAPTGIPQNNGGDQDSDNNGGPSDGDGNI